MTPSKRGGCGYNVMPGLGTYSTRPKDKGRLAREHGLYSTSYKKEGWVHAPEIQ